LLDFPVGWSFLSGLGLSLFEADGAACSVGAAFGFAGFGETARLFRSSRVEKPRGQAPHRPWMGHHPGVDNQVLNVDEDGSCVETAKPPHLALARAHGPLHVVFRA
jgi:hypothetical protein